MKLKLLRRCEPNPNENILSYLLRLAQINYHDRPSWIAGEIQSALKLNLSSLLYASENVLQSLSEMTGVDVTTLRSLTYPIASGDTQSRLLLFGRPVPRYMLKHKPCKICPQCLSSYGFAHKLWDLHPLTICPEHGTYLVCQCPQCLKDIEWNRKSITKCSCGFDLSAIKPTCALPEDLSVSSTIYNMISHRELLATPLSSMNLEDYLCFLSFLVGLQHGKTDSTGKFLFSYNTEQFSIFDIKNLHQELAKSHHILEKWPNNFFLFLDSKRGAFHGMTQLRTGFKRDFGPFHKALCQTFDGDQFRPIHIAFKDYVTNWDGGYLKGKYRVSTNKDYNHFVSEYDQKYKYRSLRATAKLMGIKLDRVKQLVDSGYLKGTVTPMGTKKCLYLIEIESIDRLQKLLRRCISLEQVALELGIDRHIAYDLTHSSILTPFIGKTVGGSDLSYVFLPDASTNLIDKISKVMIISDEPALSFRQSILKLSSIGYNTQKFIQSILIDDLYPCKKTDGTGLQSFWFSERKLAQIIQHHNHKIMDGCFTLIDAAKYLDVKQEVLLFWIKRKFIEVSQPLVGNKRWWRLSPEAIDQFKQTYVLPARIAKAYGQSPKKFIENLMLKDVVPVSGPQIDGGRQYLYLRSDLTRASYDTASCWYQADEATDIEYPTAL